MFGKYLINMTMGMFDFFKKENKEPQWVSVMPSDFVNSILAEIKNNPQACNSDQIPQGYGKFGLVKTNPIPIYGIPSNDFYLNKLRIRNGERIRWRRNGSVEANNIVNAIDEYEIYNLQGDTICLLYLCPYHWKTSAKSPEGFKLIT